MVIFIQNDSKDCKTESKYVNSFMLCIFLSLAFLLAPLKAQSQPISPPLSISPMNTQGDAQAPLIAIVPEQGDLYDGQPSLRTLPSLPPETPTIINPSEAKPQEKKKASQKTDSSETSCEVDPFYKNITDSEPCLESDSQASQPNNGQPAGAPIILINPDPAPSNLSNPPKNSKSR